MNLREQVEPLRQAALKASSPRRHAHRTASRFTWDKALAQTTIRAITRKAARRSYHPRLAVIARNVFGGVGRVAGQHGVKDAFELSGAIEQGVVAGGPAR